MIYAGSKLIKAEHSSALTNLHQEIRFLSRSLLITDTMHWRLAGSPIPAEKIAGKRWMLKVNSQSLLIKIHITNRYVRLSIGIKFLTRLNACSNLINFQVIQLKTRIQQYSLSFDLRQSIMHTEPISA